MKEAIKKAVEVLNQGGIILYPTDTIWGLGCDATNVAAIEKIYSIKKRDAGKSMLILCLDVKQVKNYVVSFPKASFRVSLLSLELPLPQDIDIMTIIKYANFFIILIF